MHPVEVVARLGGVASRAEVLRLTDRASVDRVLRTGDLVSDARGRYALPDASAAVRAASALSGVASHLSAAQAWGWKVKSPPERPQVTVPRNRRVAPERRRRVHLHWSDLGPDDVRGPITAPERTLGDCLATLPFDEALAVADSALREQAVTSAGLARLCDRLVGPGSARARRVAAAADGNAANPFESVLRALSLDVPGLRLRSQQPISWPGFHARPDLVDPDLGIVVEADSHTWHSSREALRRDCRRYNALVLAGWVVLRFTWEDVMHHPAAVQADLDRVVEHARRSLKGRRSP